MLYGASERDHVDQCCGALTATSGCYVTLLVPLVNDVIPQPHMLLEYTI